jgi:Fe-S-cluster containining protein
MQAIVSTCTIHTARPIYCQQYRALLIYRDYYSALVSLLFCIYVYRLDPSSDDALLSSEALEDVESLQHFYSTDVRTS